MEAKPPKERRYCWTVGVVFEVNPTDLCPECCMPAVTHRLMPYDQCGCFAPCDAADDLRRAHAYTAVVTINIATAGLVQHTVLDADLPKAHDGHPCTLPPGHPGPHECKEASEHCHVVAQAFLER